MKEISPDDTLNVILVHIHNRLADIDATIQRVFRNAWEHPGHIKVKVDPESINFDFSEVQDDEEGEDEDAD